MNPGEPNHLARISHQAASRRQKSSWFQEVDRDANDHAGVPLNNADVLRAPNADLAPTAFKVRLVRDVGSRFAGAKTFVDDLESSVLRFYAEAGQRIKNWQPTAPRMVDKSSDGPVGDATPEPSEQNSTS